MTPKELLYLADSLGMEQQLQIKCKDYSRKIKNPELKKMITQLAKEHQQHFNNLYSLLN